jgi:hypothetical protein
MDFAFGTGFLIASLGDDYKCVGVITQRVFLFRGAQAASPVNAGGSPALFGKDSFGEPPKPTGEAACAPRIL